MLIAENNELPQGEVDEYHVFRTRKSNHLYFCTVCKRSFDSSSPVTTCDKCSGELIELKPEHLKEKTSYRYYCPVCEKNFTVTEKASACVNCGSKFIHQYAWAGREKADKVVMRLVKIKSMFLNAFYSVGKLKLNGNEGVIKREKSRPDSLQPGNNKISETIGEVIIEQSSFVRPLIRLNLFSGNMEEMPTR